MMGKLAKIVDGVVVDVILGDEFPGYRSAPDTVAIGFRFADGAFTAPAPAFAARTVDQARADAILAVRERHAAFLRTATGYASLEERDTWFAKSVAAKAVRDGVADADQSAMITLEAQQTGETEADLVARILANAAAHAATVGWASGQRRKTEYAVGDAADTGAVETALAADADAWASKLASLA